ncbi:TetR family transcriptional regulator [Aliidongia dinghuensis]|uniref:TetR family transcriptional regulator n=1 Tax=Aliidongia dinghuensis TaxID=1867774 RepID=A0A8J3E556_9PROT|nr:TetR/AcrR family transcriptional regulator [Aliidongia dinghuensis]GGF32979.1 TetR family transcriptional regulator [Aliidongia dinghuensis]
MARPREFDEAEALAQARDLFWRQGYEATSLADLLDAMAISKSSFYETFGSKHALFLRALEQYQDERSNEIETHLKRGPTARAAIEALVRGIVACDAARGCMTCNEAVELAPRDPTVEAQVSVALAHFERQLETTIVRGQREGSIGRTYDAATLACLLAVSLSGLQVMIRAQTGRSRLDAIVESILKLLH